MTLPFADKPDDSRVYTDLKTLDLSQLSQDQFNTLRQSMESQGVDGLEDEYRRMVLLQMASNQFSAGPLPDSKIVTGTITQDGVETEIFRPNKGEVWRLVVIAGQIFNRSGTIRQLFYFSDGSTDVNFLLFDAASTKFYPMSDADYPDAAIFVTHDTYLKIEATGTSGGTFDSINYYCVVIRER